jgi:hypothetical protein
LADPTPDAPPHFPRRNRRPCRLRMNCPVPSVTSCFDVPADSLSLAEPCGSPHVFASRTWPAISFLHCSAFVKPLLAVLRFRSILVFVVAMTEPRPPRPSPGSAFVAKPQGQQRASCFLLVSPPTDLGKINSVSQTATHSELRRQQCPRCFRGTSTRAGNVDGNIYPTMGAKGSMTPSSLRPRSSLERVTCDRRRELGVRRSICSSRRLFDQPL